MQKLRELAKYRGYYRYSRKTEAIQFLKGADKEAAKQHYWSVVYGYRLDENPQAKWALDIALDRLHTMPEEVREPLSQENESRNLHFGFGMIIRNHYIYPSKLHERTHADEVSSQTVRFLLTMVNPDYTPVVLVK